MLPRPGDDLHTMRPNCLPAPTIVSEARQLLLKPHLRVKAETFPCAGHGTHATGPAGIRRFDYLMTYWVVGVGYRAGPYPSRDAALRSVAA